MKGIPSGNYAASTANKTTRGPRRHSWLKKRKAGPEAIVGRAEDPKKAHNSQMDNLMALRKNGLLTRGVSSGGLCLKHYPPSGGPQVKLPNSNG